MNVGFVSTRFAGTDGVSLESLKWATVLERNGHCCCWFSGLNDRPGNRAQVVPEAHFAHPRIASIGERIWCRDQLEADLEAAKATLQGFEPQFNFRVSHLELWQRAEAGHPWRPEMKFSLKATVAGRARRQEVGG